MHGNFSTGNGFASLASAAKQLLRPIVSEPKHQIAYNILVNWKNIVDEKYQSYCTLEKVVLDRQGKCGTVYLISYNSSASFYLGSGGQYLIDRINSILGWEFVTKISIREIPTIVNPTPGAGRRKGVVIKKDTTRNGDNALANSLEDLGECFRIAEEDLG